MAIERSENGVTLSPAQLRNRRMRNLAIGLSVGAMAALFYALTIVKLGGRVLLQH